MDAPELPPESERRIRVSQAATLFPPGRHGKPRRPATIARYIAAGCRGVRLEGGRDTSGSWWTTAESVRRFLARLTLANPVESDGVKPTPRATARRVADALAEFRRLKAKKGTAQK